MALQKNEKRFAEPQKTIKQDKKAEINLAAATTKFQLDEESDFVYWQSLLERIKAFPSGPSVLLDAGCGSGTFGLSLVKSNATVVGIDICKSAVSAGKRKSKKQKLDFLSIVGDLENLPLKESTVDTYLCRAALHHFLSVKPVIKEINRVLKADGKIVFIEPNGSNPIVKLSTLGERFSGNLLIALGLDTPNETIHDHKRYVEALLQQDFIDVNVCSCYPGSLPPLPNADNNINKTSITIRVLNNIVRLRQFCYLIADKILSEPIRGNVLVITARKPSSKVAKIKVKK